MDEDPKPSSSNTETTSKHVSKNPFLNFLVDFRKQNKHLSPRQIVKMAGEKWRQMTPAEKQPYIDAAKNATKKNIPRKRKNKKGHTVSLESKRRILPVTFASSKASSSSTDDKSGSGSRSRSRSSRSTRSRKSYTSDYGSDSDDSA